MPRLTNHHYLYRHASLKTVWRSWPDLFGLLSPAEQHQLHAYYRPGEQLSPLHLLVHRRQIDRKQPGVSHVAGKAFNILHRAFGDICERYPEDAVLDGQAVRHYLATRTQPARHRTSPRSGRNLRVRPVLLPTPDIRSLAKIFMDIGADLTNREDAAEPPDQAAAA